MAEPSDTAFEQSQTEPLPGTVKLYQRHLIVCTGSASWPARIETDGGFLQQLSEAVTARSVEMPFKVKITACDEGSDGSGGGYDILVFPDAVRYRRVRERYIPSLIEDHLIGNQISKRLPSEPLTGRHIFVCLHDQRDRRCGVCGPPLIEQFKAVLAERGLSDRVAVRGTSHVGGHRFAGNVLIYPEGDWYGRVTIADISRIIDQHIVAGQIVADLWRGGIGLSPQEQVQQVEAWLND